MYTDCGWGMYLFAVILCIDCTSVWDSAEPFISFLNPRLPYPFYHAASLCCLNFGPIRSPVVPSYFARKSGLGRNRANQRHLGDFHMQGFFFFLWNIFPFGLCELCAAHQSYPTLHDPSRPVSRNAQFDVCVKIDLYDNDTIFPPFIVQGFYRYFSGKAHSA